MFVNHPLPSPALVVVWICYFFSYSIFLREDPVCARDARTFHKICVVAVISHGACHLLMFVCYVFLNHPLPSSALVVVLIFYFFSYSIFYVQRPSVVHRFHKKTDLQGGTINNPPQFPQVDCSHPASTSGVHLRGRLFKVCCRFCGSLT